MTIDDIVVQIDSQILRLQQVRALLAGTDSIAKRKPGRPASGAPSAKAISIEHTKIAGKIKHRRTMSVQAREKIAAAQRARWAKSRRAAKKEGRSAAVSTVAKTSAIKTTKTGGPRKTVPARKGVPSKPKTSSAPSA